MKIKYQQPSPEIRAIFNEEWRFAKKILIPYLDHKKIPKLYVADVIKNGWVGIHLGREGLYQVRLGKRWVKNSHAIALQLGQSIEEMRHTIRHEICHVIEQNHGNRFKLLLHGLEEGRASYDRIIFGEKKTTSPEVA